MNLKPQMNGEGGQRELDCENAAENKKAKTHGAAYGGI